jgi:NADP-dependent 3-hydroxy acid dehydrogenase YdfG
MNAKIVAITGPNSGVAFGAAKQPAGIAAIIVMAGRHRGQIKASRKEIIKNVPTANHMYFIADLSSQVAISSLATGLHMKPHHIDALINNAGGIVDQGELTIETIQEMFAANHVINVPVRFWELTERLTGIYGNN